MANQNLLPSLWSNRIGDLEPFRSLHDRFERLFDEFGKLPAVTGGEKALMVPRVDVKETDTGFELTAELPGVDKKDIDIRVSDNVVTIKAEKKSSREEKEKDYHLVERSFGSFQRSLSLPCDVDSKRVEASLTDGVLKLVLPKAEHAEEKVKKVEVQ